MTSSQIERLGKQITNRMKEIERAGRTCEDEIQKNWLREQWRALRVARDGLRVAWTIAAKKLVA